MHLPTRCAVRPSSSTPFGRRLDLLLKDAAAGRLLEETHLPSTRKDLLYQLGSCNEFIRSGSRYPPLGLNQLKAVIGDASSVDVLEADGNLLTNERTVQALRDEMALALGMTITCGTKRLVKT